MAEHINQHIKTVSTLNEKIKTSLIEELEVVKIKGQHFTPARLICLTALKGIMASPYIEDHLLICKDTYYLKSVLNKA